ncbi:MAG: large conductance mechanosensitive channel protein MscL [Oscillospiraceae bacterium]|nr:large conductance mechanosensitive channel protein MscL [Oscillospiraceae bacterium]
MKKFIEEFKTFIAKGNVLDMAVGVIIATAFGKITTSLVNDVFMPFIGWIIGDINLSELNIVLTPEVLNEAGEIATPAVVVAIGTFISTIIDFVLIAFVVFLIVKAFNTAKEKAEAKKKAEEEAAAAAEEEAPAEPSEEVKLLMEIRDFLKK